MLFYYLLGIAVGILITIVFSRIGKKKDLDGEVIFDIYNEDCPVTIKFSKDVGALMGSKVVSLVVVNNSDIYNPYNENIEKGGEKQ
jgi:hypothetical protein